MTPNGRKWLSLNQVAEKLSVSRTMVNQYRERKAFPVPIQLMEAKNSPSSPTKSKIGWPPARQAGLAIELAPAG